MCVLCICVYTYIYIYTRVCVCVCVSFIRQPILGPNPWPQKPHQIGVALGELKMRDLHLGEGRRCANEQAAPRKRLEKGAQLFNISRIG